MLWQDGKLHKLRFTPARRRVSAKYGNPPTLGRPAIARFIAPSNFSIALLNGFLRPAPIVPLSSCACPSEASSAEANRFPCAVALQEPSSGQTQGVASSASTYIFRPREALSWHPG